jgi:hypothetical protein
MGSQERAKVPSRRRHCQLSLQGCKSFTSVEASQHRDKDSIQ